jgi:hypothetical protein
MLQLLLNVATTDLGAVGGQSVVYHVEGDRVDLLQ